MSFVASHDSAPVPHDSGFSDASVNERSLRLTGKSRPTCFLSAETPFGATKTNGLELLDVGRSEEDGFDDDGFDKDRSDADGLVEGTSVDDNVIGDSIGGDDVAGRLMPRTFVLGDMLSNAS